jgi:prepilin-type N-terminal cleavage/methylation domain-containing protein/prepilin-type processing-associated H-X9-DG protein
MNKLRINARKNYIGFTLIELLVVIAIIAIGLGLLQYGGDYDEQQPLTIFGANVDSKWPADYKWMDAVYPYVKSEQVFNCPSDSPNTGGRPYKYAGNSPGAFTSTYGSYVYNNAYWDGGNKSASGRTYRHKGPQGVKLAAIEAPTTTAWILEQNVAPRDGTNWSNGLDISWKDYTQIPTIKTSSSGIKWLDTQNGGDVPERHLGTTVVLYCDGHAKSISLDALTQKKTIPVMVELPTGFDQPVLTAFTIQDD